MDILSWVKHTKRYLSTDDYMRNPNGSTLSEEDLRALSVGAVMGEQTSCYIDTLETGMEQDRLDEGLQEYYGVVDRESALSTLDWMKNEGHRDYYDKIMPILQTIDSKEWLTAINNTSFKDHEKAPEYLENLSGSISDLMKSDDMGLTESDFSKGILAWDMGRMVVVARMCFNQGLISAEEAWAYIREALVQTKIHFKDWKEVANSYVIGRAMWSGEGVMLDGIKTIAKELLTKERSPWLSVTL